MCQSQSVFCDRCGFGTTIIKICNGHRENMYSMAITVRQCPSFQQQQKLAKAPDEIEHDCWEEAGRQYAEQSALKLSMEFHQKKYKKQE